MLQSQITILMTIGVAAAGASILTTDNAVAMLAGAVGAFANALSAVGLFNVEVVSNGTTVAAGSQPALALFAAGLAFVAIVPALTGPLNVVDETRRAGL